MVWIVQLDGTNDYFDLGTTVTASSNCSIEIKFRVESTAGDSFLRLVSDSTTASSTTDRIIVESNGNRVIVNSGGGTSATWSGVFGSALSNGQIITIKVVTNGSTSKTLYVNGVSKGTATTDFISLGRWRYFGVNYSSYSNISYYYIDFTDNANSANSHYWDATSSSHTSGTPVLTDTLNSLNATGVNMLTDGSVWIDLGGGGITLLPSSLVNSSSIGTHTLLVSPKVLPTSIANTEVFGSSTVLVSPLVLPSSISNTSTIGDFLLLTQQYLNPSSITNTSTVGNTTVTINTLIQPSSITNTSVFGTASLLSATMISAVGIDNLQAFGSILIVEGAQYLSIPSVTNTNEFGTLDIHTAAKIVEAIGAASGLTFGYPYISGGVLVAQSFTLPLASVIFVPKLLKVTEQDT